MPCNNKKGASPKGRPASFRRGCLKGPFLVQLSDSLRNCKKLDANCKKCNSLAIEKGLVFAGNLHHSDTALRNCRWGMSVPMLRLPPLGAIEAFVTVGRLGSIKNAAEVLALSPSALSRRVQTLENRMGEALFERKHQALSLTIAGERLLEAVAPLIDDLGRIFDSMSGPHELRLRA